MKHLIIVDTEVLVHRIEIYFTDLPCLVIQAITSIELVT